MVKYNETLNTYLDAIRLEEEVGTILTSKCSENEKIVKEESFLSGKLRADFYLPNGCATMSWPPQTVVEIKIVLQYSSISRIYQSYFHLYQNGEIKKLIIIYKNSSNSFNKYLISLNAKFIETYNIDELKKRGAFENNEKNPSKIFSEIDVIDKARDAFNNMRYTFFLGAGLSMDAKLPSWSELLEFLLTPNNNKPFTHINTANSDAISASMGYSAIVTGRYALDGYLRDTNKSKEDNYQEFIEKIRTVLYRKKSNESALITSVSRAIKRKKPAQIITYNFDELLDELLNKEDFYSVSDNFIPRTNQIPIYHVHGMISRDNTKPSNSVLSEKDYHQLYSSPHNWANVVQLNALYTSTCFFIGFSMTDPNQRRLLELAREKDINSDESDKLPHYVFLKKTPLKGEASENVNNEHWKEIEYMMSDFGLNVIWFNDFRDLPKILDYISGIAKSKPQI